MISKEASGNNLTKPPWTTPGRPRPANKSGVRAAHPFLPRPGTANPGTAELQLGIVMANPGTAELQLGILHANTPPTAYDPDPPPGSW